MHLLKLKQGVWQEGSLFHLVGMPLSVIFALVSLVGCSTTDDDKPGWYNAPGLREVFGDYEKTERFFISDAEELARLRDRGEYLALNVAACGTCHAADSTKSDGSFSGGQLLTDSFGPVRSANITPDPESGIGKWNTAEVMRAIRASIDSEGRPLSLDTHRAYRWMSDQDAKAIAVYILSREPRENRVERRRLGGFERNRFGLFPEHADFAGYVPALKSPDELGGRSGPSDVAYDARWGKYLANHVAQCGTCHTRDGGYLGTAAPYSGTSSNVVSSLWSAQTWRSFYEAWKANPNDGSSELLSEEAKLELARRGEETGRDVGTVDESAVTKELRDSGVFPILGPDIRGSASSGLAAWTTEDIVNYLTTGRAPNDSRLRDPRLCPWSSFAGMGEADKRSIAAFLKQL